MAADRRKTLDKIDRRETAAGNLVRDVPFVVLDANGFQLLRKISIADIAPLQLSFEYALYLSLPVLGFDRHGGASYSVIKIIIYDVFVIDKGDSIH